MDTTEHYARPLLEQIAVDLIAPKQRDATLPVGALSLQTVELGGKFGDLCFILLSGLDAARTAMGMMHEVAATAAEMP